MSPARVTIAEIAACAGVSVPTVSKVLNGRPDVSRQTRRRIEALLAEHDYIRSGTRTRRRAGVIDLVFTELTPWSLEIIRGAEQAARAGRSRIVVEVVAGDAERDRWLDRLASGQTQGLILVLTELSAAHRQRLAELHLPVVIVDPVGHPDPDSRIPSVGAANWAGGLMATEHLIQLGHRRIGKITGPAALLCSQARLDGYRAALERAGIPVDPRLIRSGDFHYRSALLAAGAMLRLPDRPTAIFAGSDEQALGVYEAARRQGLRVPEELSVVGFDDVSPAEWASPPLTTVRQPLAEMAALATRTLLSLADGSHPVNHRLELATELVVRDSTAPPQE
ncbi:MAG: LacI family DNA-binding transcriptional regulator [Micromonosporaceae bacterium]|jgi:DNA-binding LacI/PurR family transcriptional regulator|nr:LacI family DNA-binding transcriptional regulator [Micromonosporaceae bacterium]